MLTRLFTLFFAVLVASPVAAQKRIALLIGNKDYKPSVGQLINPFNDIKLVGDALKSVGFEVLNPIKNATRAEMLEALENYAARLKRAGPSSVGFVYYSGHGIASKGSNYLIPVDVAKPSTKLLRAHGVKQSEILEILHQEAPKAAHYLVIDACRNELRGTRGAKGFVAVGQQTGTLIAFATAPGGTAADSGDGSGPYARALAEELVRPNITDLQMFSNVRYQVSTSTGGDQVPWTLDGIVRRDRFKFGGLKVTRSVEAGPVHSAAGQANATAPQRDNEEKGWEFVRPPWQRLSSLKRTAEKQTASRIRGATLAFENGAPKIYFSMEQTDRFHKQLGRNYLSKAKAIRNALGVQSLRHEGHFKSVRSSTSGKQVVERGIWAVGRAMEANNSDRIVLLKDPTSRSNMQISYIVLSESDQEHLCSVIPFQRPGDDARAEASVNSLHDGTPNPCHFELGNTLRKQR